MSANQLDVIYVDDEEDIREVALMSLEDVGGLSVEAFSSAQSLLDAGPPPPDVFLLDVMMPGMNGVELLKRLRASPVYQSVPAIFMTAKAHPAEVESLIGAGAIGVICKPFDPMTLADEVRGLMDSHERH